jgi:hypothetical protein
MEIEAEAVTLNFEEGPPAWNMNLYSGPVGMSSDSTGVASGPGLNAS